MSVIDIIKDKKALIQRGGEVFSIKRLKTGIFNLDVAMGGGLPLHRISLFYGVKSGGKTTTALKVVAEYQKQFPKSEVVYIETENALNKDWMITCGVNLDKLILVSPSSAEETGDIINELIKKKTGCLIVVDSLAHLTPFDEKEKSVAEWQQGLLARILNKSLRKWVIEMNTIAEKETIPTILLINQVRQKIGVLYGDPETCPGGLGIGFVTSIEVRFWISGSSSYKYVTDKNAPDYVEIHFNIVKNKTFIPRIEGSWKLALRNHNGYIVGESIDVHDVIKAMVNYGYLKKEKGKYVLGKETFNNQEEMEEYLKQHKDIYKKLKDEVTDWVVQKMRG